tara:strand:+ start:349 stop:516 length:168 start_codon:yes stop_codon:yes gene_type:complete
LIAVNGDLRCDGYWGGGEGSALFRAWLQEILVAANDHAAGSALGGLVGAKFRQRR